jgi:hypothetical protein
MVNDDGSNSTSSNAVTVNDASMADQTLGILMGGSRAPTEFISSQAENFK